MPWTLWAGLTFAVFSRNAFAEFSSYHNANPIGWMYQLPVGETPGWSTGSWLNLELNHSNIWSVPMSMTDKRNGNIYAYRADFEQSSAIANLGFALGPRLAVSVEAPYANHNGGFMDDFIDQFHLFIQSDRFERNDYPKYGNHFLVQTNGVDNLASEHAEGVGNVKAKLKLWLLKLKSPTPGVCECGFAISGQAKFPTQTWKHGLSSGSNDYTGMLHAGVPLGSNSGTWFTAGLTHVGEHKLFEGWPMRRWLQMYELSFDLGAGPQFGFILQARYESPLMMSEHLSFNYSSTDPKDQAIERINSGWNSMVYWRGSESVGIRWRWGQGNQVNLLFVEDWGGGKYDSSGGLTYINNAPDVELLTQWHFVF